MSPLIVAVALDAVRARSRFRTFAMGLAAGGLYFAGTLYWVVDVMRTFGGLSETVAVLVAVLLVVFMALYPAIFALLLGRAVRRWGMTGVWLAPLIWVATEWLRSTVGGGFPWVLLGASQATVLPVIQVSSVVGVYGVSCLVALVGTAAAAVALSRRRAHRRGALAVAGLLVAVTIGGMWRVSSGRLLREGQPIRVGLVQGSVKQADKYDARFRDAITQRYIDLSRQTIGAGAQLVIWPEASSPFIFDRSPVLAEPVRRLAVESRTPIIIGTDEVPLVPPGATERWYNSAVLVGADGRSRQSYRKVQLVPFGEYVPLKRMLFFVGPLVEAVSDFSAGTEPLVLDTGVGRVSVAICYETVYPWLSRAFVNGGTELLATITNDAWFGESSAAYQHFEQAGIRAVEHGRYMVRAANTGISGAVDPYGRVLARTGLFVPVAITVDVRLETARTIYSRLGDVVAWLGLAVAAAVMIGGRHRQ